MSSKRALICTPLMDRRGKSTYKDQNNSIYEDKEQLYCRKKMLQKHYTLRERYKCNLDRKTEKIKYRKMAVSREKSHCNTINAVLQETQQI